jgi:ribose transport system ATP-binding protein
MIYVSHRLDEVFEIADRMIVLRDGRIAREREVAKTTPDEMILLIVGREPSQVFRRPPDRHGGFRPSTRSSWPSCSGFVSERLPLGREGLLKAGLPEYGRIRSGQ